MAAAQPSQDRTEHSRSRAKAKSRFIGGTFFFENHESHPLLKVLPTFLHFSAAPGKTGKDSKVVDWFGTTLDFIVTEAASRRPGAEPIISRLSDILFIQAVRSYAGEVSGERPNWFAAAADPQISEAIANIHRTPQSHWTVERLATLSRMSRSAFANRFTELVGEPPLRYLSRWRMHKAIEMLREGRQTTAEIASLVGYESEAAFSKAFKKWNGQGPGPTAAQPHGKTALRNYRFREKGFQPRINTNVHDSQKQMWEDK